MTPVFRRGDDKAFERLYSRHVRDVYRYAAAMLDDASDAEDVTQTTFLNAYRSFNSGVRPERPRSWLLAIAHNVCRQRFRQSSRRPSEVSFEDDIADTIADEDTPSGDDIRRALGHLAFNQRAALVMRELEGRSYAEIAEILDVSTSAVETLIFRARRALREQLEGSITCGEAEFAISRQLDGRLPRQERGQLRAHLRECSECASFARRQRAQRGALKTLALVPVPTSLTSLFGGGGAAVGTGLALKAAAAVTAGLVIGGAGYEGVQHAPWHASKRSASGGAGPAPQAGRGALAPDNESLAPNRSPSAVVALTGKGAQKTHGKSAAAHAKRSLGKTSHRKGHAYGRGKTRYAGDASVAARHVKVVHPHVRAHPVRHTPRRRLKPKPQLPPGPFDVKPPSANGKGK